MQHYWDEMLCIPWRILSFKLYPWGKGIFCPRVSPSKHNGSTWTCVNSLLIQAGRSGLGGGQNSAYTSNQPLGLFAHHCLISALFHLPSALFNSPHTHPLPACAHGLPAPPSLCWYAQHCSCCCNSSLHCCNMLYTTLALQHLQQWKHVLPVDVLNRIEPWEIFISYLSWMFTGLSQ